MGIDLDEPMFTLDANNEHVLTPIGEEVTSWSQTLPDGGSQGIPGKRKQSAVCSAFNSKFHTTIEDFGLTKEEYNHVMGGNGPPRYDMFTGNYYDYGAYENGHPSAELICTNPDLLVIKGSADGVVPPPDTGTPPPDTGGDRPPRPGRDERQAERQASQDERQAGRDENQAARQAERDARQEERKADRGRDDT